MLFVYTKFTILFFTISIPLSSDALIYNVIKSTYYPYNYFLYILINDVFPVPGGPLNIKLGNSSF
jgi:hypothetical protein